MVIACRDFIQPMIYLKQTLLKWALSDQSGWFSDRIDRVVPLFNSLGNFQRMI